MSNLSENPLALLADNLALHSKLSAEDRQAVLDLPHRTRAFESSSYLVSEGERPTHCAVLLSGFAYRQKQTRGGARQIVSIHIPSEALDFQHLFLDVADHSIQMLTRGEVALIAMRDLQPPSKPAPRYTAPSPGASWWRRRSFENGCSMLAGGTRAAAWPTCCASSPFV